jgi:anti-sigma factor RsiW
MSRATRFSGLKALLRCVLNRPVQSPTPDLTCQQVTDLIADYLAGTLDPETTSAFEEHLRDCRDCVAFLNTYKRTSHMVRSLRCEEVPSEMAERVRCFLEALRSRHD